MAQECIMAPDEMIKVAGLSQGMGKGRWMRSLERQRQ
jgi:hypothetical protein